MRFFNWSAAPVGAHPVQRKNFINVQIDAVGIGLASAAAPFLPVFLARLGASNFEIGLLSALPSLAGFVLGLFVGRFLQSRPQIVPWFSAARLLVVSGYALTGIVGFFVPQTMLTKVILLVWALITIPQTVVFVAFNVVMNAVAGPAHRYELMSRRWSILGFTTAITVAIVGQVLDRVAFPLNYQLVFIALSVGGLVSYYFSSHIQLPDNPQPKQETLTFSQRSRQYARLVWGEKPFMLFVAKRFVFLTGVSLSLPLFPLYYVREVQASDSWIGVINTVQTAVLLIGYFLWTRQSRLRGSRFVLLWATFGLSLYPALTAMTLNVQLITLYAGIAGIFQAGIDLVFFDELMKTVPAEYSAIFVSLAQSLQHFSAFVAPLVGTFFAGQIGLSGALMISAALRLLGFGLFVWWKSGEIRRQTMQG